MDQPAALRPLLEAMDDIRRLEDYDTPEELAAAIAVVVDAIEASLRIRLRRDPGAPDEHRLNALAADRLSLDDVVKTLRTRDLISLEAAGSVHEARAAARRAEGGDLRAADADVVRKAAERVRSEMESAARDEVVAESRRMRPDAGGPQDKPESAGGAPPSADVAVRRAGESRWMRWIAAAFAAVILLGAAWVAFLGGNNDYQDAVGVFRAGRMDAAAAAFERVVADQPRNVTAMLYLARSYRRVERWSEAADVLRRALKLAPEDADVWRELGHLFLDLGRPTSAVAQYERALEHGPEDPLSWAALIRGLRQLDDPRAEQLLRDAPAEVRATLSE